VPPSAIPYRAIAAQCLEEIGESWDRENVRNAFRELQASDDAYALASRLEAIAYATVRVFAQQGLPPSIQHLVQNVIAIARPFECAEARLVIYTPARALHIGVWPTVGRLTVWRSIVDAIWDALEQFVRHFRANS